MEAPKFNGEDTKVGYEIVTAPSRVYCTACGRRVSVAIVREKIFLAIVSWNQAGGGWL